MNVRDGSPPRRLGLVAILIVAACSRAGPSSPTDVVSKLPSPRSCQVELAAPERGPPRAPSSTFDSYASTGAVGVRGLPIAVNRAFDFAIALAMPDMGAALAALKRLEANRKLANELASLARPPVQEAFTRGLGSTGCGCALLVDHAVSVSGILFGERQARLELSLEIEGEPVSFHWISEAREQEGEGSWTDASGRALGEALFAGAAALGRAFVAVRCTSARPSTRGPAYRCSAGDGRSISGELVNKLEDGPLLYVERPPMYLLCDAAINVGDGSPSR